MPGAQEKVTGALELRALPAVSAVPAVPALPSFEAGASSASCCARRHRTEKPVPEFAGVQSAQTSFGPVFHVCLLGRFFVEVIITPGVFFDVNPGSRRKVQSTAANLAFSCYVPVGSCLAGSSTATTPSSGSPMGQVSRSDGHSTTKRASFSPHLPRRCSEALMACSV